MTVANTPGINEREARTPVNALERITATEIQKLAAARILTLNDLWIGMGAGKELSKIDELAATTEITSTRLVELLPSSLVNILYTELLRRAKDLDLQVPSDVNGLPTSSRDISFGRKISLGAKKVGPWIRRHLLDVILLLCVLGFIVLAARAAGLLDNYPSLGLSESVVITKRDLKAGNVLRSEKDLSTARLQLKENYFKSTSEVEGLILQRDVSMQKPLRSSDLLRFQVVATRDILSGDVITADAVKLAWAPYDSKALIRTADAVDRKSRYAIRKDYVVLAEMVETKLPE